MIKNLHRPFKYQGGFKGVNMPFVHASGFEIVPYYYRNHHAKFEIDITILNIPKLSIRVMDGRTDQ